MRRSQFHCMMEKVPFGSSLNLIGRYDGGFYRAKPDIYYDIGCNVQILLKKCIGRRYGKFPDLLIFEIGKWNSPFWIALSNCKNIQKKFLEKVDHRGRYSSTFKMGTALRKRGVATSILRPHPRHPHYFGTETWWSHPENLSLIALLVPKIFNVLRKKIFLKSEN